MRKIRLRVLKRFPALSRVFHTACPGTVLMVSLAAIFAVGITGCQGNPEEKQPDAGQSPRSGEAQPDAGDTQLQAKKQRIAADSQKIIKCYASIIRQAKKELDTDTFKLQQDIISCLGKSGYIAVDLDNQIDMANYQQAEQFCQSAMKGEKAKATLLLVMDNGGFIRYDMASEDKKLTVTVSSVFLGNEEDGAGYFETFTSSSWSYTKKGYLLFEQYHMSGFDGPPGQTAIRIRPLDETCRELNRKYVLPLGYRGHKLLIADWDGKDYGELDFYDLYEVMYTMKYGKDVPYADEYTRVQYEVPEEDFEEPIQTYLDVDSALIRANTVYHADSRSYRYRPRGLYDSIEPYEPYPEVTAYERQEDGKLKLTVEAVWALKNSDCVMTSELVVRPLKNGRFQYVSNRVVSVSKDMERLWYKPRLTDGEWERLTQ